MFPVNSVMICVDVFKALKAEMQGWSLSCFNHRECGQLLMTERADYMLLLHI